MSWHAGYGKSRFVGLNTILQGFGVAQLEIAGLRIPRRGVKKAACQMGSNLDQNTGEERKDGQLKIESP